VLLLVFGFMILSCVINLLVCPSRVNIYAWRVPMTWKLVTDVMFAWKFSEGNDPQSC